MTKYIVGHYVGTDDDMPDNLGEIDDTLSIERYREDSQLDWFPDGVVVELDED